MRSSGFQTPLSRCHFLTGLVLRRIASSLSVSLSAVSWKCSHFSVILKEIGSKADLQMLFDSSNVSVASTMPSFLCLKLAAPVPGLTVSEAASRAKQGRVSSPHDPSSPRLGLTSPGSGATRFKPLMPCCAIALSVSPPSASEKSPKRLSMPFRVSHCVVLLVTSFVEPLMPLPSVTALLSSSAFRLGAHALAALLPEPPGFFFLPLASS